MSESQKNGGNESPHLFDPQVVKIIGELIAIDLSNVPCSSQNLSSKANFNGGIDRSKMLNLFGIGRGGPSPET